VEYKILKDNIGYIKINQFNQHTYDNLVPVLSKFYKENISNIVIDLRDNPGGLLDEVVEILGLFIPEGPIVHIKYRGDIERTYYSKLKKPKYKLAVLINENSASASEIFAGAVQDTKVGTIVGVPSYGKGTVQQIVPLPNGDGMKLTIAEYLTPNKRSIHKKGIKPDIIVENKDDTKDTQLEKAIEALHVIIP
jgi:carboxyl-terminal processing protease